jgi:apolipoprotein D and lipocalin family protein
MTGRRACLGVTLLTIPWLAAGAAASLQSLRVVESLDLKRYAGRWYETARLPDERQRQCVADVTVSYVVRDDGRLDVVNRCQTKDGGVNEVHGVARKAGDGRSAARLEVRFGRGFPLLPAPWTDRWIIGLGPDYMWAVVGMPSRESLWILSRTPGMSAASYAQALEIAKGNGFDTTRLIKTPQNLVR